MYRHGLSILLSRTRLTGDGICLVLLVVVVVIDPATATSPNLEVLKRVWTLSSRQSRTPFVTAAVVPAPPPPAQEPVDGSEYEDSTNDTTDSLTSKRSDVALPT